MLAGELTHTEPYHNVHPRMEQAFRFFEDCLAQGVRPGRYTIDGDDIYAVVFQYVPQEKEDPRYETHDRYLDIQCIAQGSEFQYYIPRRELVPSTPYDEVKDVTFYPFCGGSKLHLKAGDFAVYFPSDGHLPAMPDECAENCIRIVVKIKC